MEMTLVVALDGGFRNILKLSSFWVTLVLKRTIDNNIVQRATLYDNRYKTCKCATFSSYSLSLHKIAARLEWTSDNNSSISFFLRVTAASLSTSRWSCGAVYVTSSSGLDAWLLRWRSEHIHFVQLLNNSQKYIHTYLL